MMAVATTLMLLGIGMKGAIPLGIARGLLNLLPFLGLIFSLALPLAAAILQFNSPGPFIVITLTILLLHVVSANLLTPKFIATRVSIGTGGGDDWDSLLGLVVGCNGLVAGCAADGIRQARRRFASILMSLIQHARTGASFDSTLGAIRRNGFAPGDSLPARPPGSQTRRKRVTGWR